jgi:Ca-activated chloride channel family protein
VTVDLAHPELLWIAAATPLAVAALHLYDRARRRALLRRLGEAAVIGRVLASASPGRRLGKDCLLAAALMLIVGSLARPRVEGTRRVEVEGLDVVIAVDVSKSMLVPDVGPTPRMPQRSPGTRLARARELAGAIIDELAGDRVAPVAFAGAAAHFPLTDDHQVARLFLFDLGPADLPPGSNLVEVFRVARCLLRVDLYNTPGCEGIGRRGTGGDPLPGAPDSADDSEDDRDDAALSTEIERGKAVLLLTDGGGIDAATLGAVAELRELGIAVILVGLGSAGGGEVSDVGPGGSPSGTPRRGADGAPIRSARDDAKLRELAAAAGDPRRYLIADETGEVKPLPVVEALRSVSRGLASKRVRDLRDIYQPFLFVGLMLLVVEVAIGTRRRRRYPEAS